MAWRASGAACGLLAGRIDLALAFVPRPPHDELCMWHHGAHHPDDGLAQYHLTPLLLVLRDDDDTTNHHGRRSTREPRRRADKACSFGGPGCLGGSLALERTTTVVWQCMRSWALHDADVVHDGVTAMSLPCHCHAARSAAGLPGCLLLLLRLLLLYLRVGTAWACSESCNFDVCVGQVCLFVRSFAFLFLLSRWRASRSVGAPFLLGSPPRHRAALGLSLSCDSDSVRCSWAAPRALRG